MSGHSKWASIRHKKAVVDAKRGKAFSRLIREIMVAAKMGGSDVDTNPRLRVAVQSAKDANMPKDTMARAVKKGAGEIEGASYEDVAYEGYGPGGVAVYIEGSTDNKNRTAAEIRHTFAKHGGNLGESGCVSWMFNRKGQIIVSGEGVDEDGVIEVALEAGAEDVQNEDGTFVVLSDWHEISTVRAGLEAGDLDVESSSIAMVPTNTVKVDGKQAEGLIRLVSALEECDDVNTVSANFEMDDALLEQLVG